MPTLDDLRQQVADAERAAEAERQERARLETRLAELRTVRSESNGLPFPPSNQMASAQTSDERRFLAIQAKNKDNTQRADIDFVDAAWAQRMSFAELLRSYGNDPNFATPNVREFLKDVHPRDLSATPKR